MKDAYERNLDLNLLRVFVAVAEAGSVTAAAQRLYVTQPAVSAALKRLTSAVGAKLFVRVGRGLALSARGERLLGGARPHLYGLLEAARAPGVFDPAQSDRTIRIGLSDASESWLLPPLLRVLAKSAPRMRLVVLPVQFRTVGAALASAQIDVAVTVADELPAGTRRKPLFHGRFVGLFDPRHVQLGLRPSLARWLACDHVIVSYNGDLRGIVEDMLGVQRRVRVSVPTFHSVGAVVDGSALVATLPERIASDVRALRPRLRTCALPVRLDGGAIEMVWPAATDDDEAVGYVRDVIATVGKA